MKRFFKSLVLVTVFVGFAVPSWSQTPSTEGTDFWVTFLRSGYKDGASGSVTDTGDPEKLTLTISARKACTVKIENTNANLSKTLSINPGNTTVPMIGDKAACYSYQSEQAAYTALHVTATEDISLFAGNYRDKSFDAANIYPTTALLDDYLIQTYPPSAHADQPQGTHFAIVATEDNTTVDYVLTAKTVGNNTGTHSVTLQKGQVYYVWTGRKAGDEADLSGTTIKARDGKKIAVFQGSSHTNLPYLMRDRDHLFSQAMPTAYWGSEFGITSSMHHRRDIIAIMAINDGTSVYLHDKDGETILLHTFNFAVDKKHYWTFELGDEEAYSTHNSSPFKGKLPEPDVADSSCYITTSCPVGVHLFMVSNTYDEPTAIHTSGSIGDPAMLWISPIEQVIKEISFSTYADGTNIHYMNILTTTADVPNIVWTDEKTKTKRSLTSYFHPLSGNSNYSYARVEINDGSHSLKGNVGFLAHVYGFGERCSYAYSCGSSTIQRSVTFNGTPLMIDSVYPGTFCVNDTIDMKLNIGNNDYESIVWDYGDGITYSAPKDAPNDQKKQTSHAYTSPGWYDLRVSAVYVNQCTGDRHNDDMQFSFRVVRPDTIRNRQYVCLGVNEPEPENKPDTVKHDCDTVFITTYEYGHESIYEYYDTVFGGTWINGKEYKDLDDYDIPWTIPMGNKDRCDSNVICHLRVYHCLEMTITEYPEHVCPGGDFVLTYTKTGDIGESHLIYGTEDLIIHPENGYIELPTSEMKPGIYHATITIEDTVCRDEATNKPRIVSIPLDFSVYYPDTIFKYKFNNVLAVYNKEHNGGYDFIEPYQWYRKEKDKTEFEAIPGATSSIYHTAEPFEVGDEYFVMLTRSDGLVLPSCPQTILNNDPPVSTQQAPAASKQIINRQFIIRMGEKSYNIYGQRVQ